MLQSIQVSSDKGMKFLEIEGARQNNLKNISLRLPHNSFIVITGLSGSGKSSLAFDTIFAEGQWRFIESLSTYARLFLEKLDRPDVDSIRNIRPAIALEQKNPIKGSRSTVGTLTEIYDYLRVLYCKLAKPYCLNCNREIIKWTVDQAVTHLLENYHSERAIITFFTDTDAEQLMKKGFYRVWDGNRFYELQRQMKGPFEVVVDRVIIKDPERLYDSLEIAWKNGNERVDVVLFRGSTTERLSFSSQNICDSCGFRLPEPSMLLFSFNHPVGACPECKGFGNILIYDESLIVPDESLSLREGAIEPWEKPAASWWKEQLLRKAKKYGIDIDKPYHMLTEQERNLIFKGTEDFYGIEDFFEELESRKYKLHVRVFLSRYRSQERCPVCKGKRLKPEALAYRINNKDIAELGELPIGELLDFIRNLELTDYEKKITDEIVKQIQMKLEFLIRVGLDYLTLNRLGKTLSGGEYQRVNLANQIGARLTGTLYVLDEPTVGLHARDTQRIVNIIKEMAEAGNTIIVVEHDATVISSADWVVELGPEGGRNGGRVVFSGAFSDFLKEETLTSQYIKGRDRGLLLLYKKRSLQHKGPKRFLILRGAKGNNLKDVDLRIPLGTFTVVTGVSGSGKSSLVVETLYRAVARRFKVITDRPLPFRDIEGIKYIKGVRLIDQSPIGKTPRSNPVTYLKIFDFIRKLYAEQPYAVAHGYGPGFFSFNLKGGRCERCKGEGYEKLEMYFFEDIYVTCEECKGKRYKPEALKVLYKGKNIHEVLQMTVDEAMEFFAEQEQIINRLKILKDLALGYLILGQPSTTLSGGEAQRLKICAEMTFNRKRDILYILDEPTVGLHYRDVLALVGVLRRLVDDGNTVVIIEHNLDVIGIADWVIDLGPEGGPAGGKIIYEGPPEGLLTCKESITGRFLYTHTKEWN